MSTEPADRGSDLSRIAAFSDGVFAIAITLLVLQIEQPTNASNGPELWVALGDESGDFFAFGLSFAVIGAFWVGHHRFIRTLREFDPGLIWRNLLYLGLMVLIPFFSQLVGDFGDISLAVFLYAANLALLTGAQILMLTHAIGNGLLKPGYLPHARNARKSLAYNGIIFAGTAPFAFLIGAWITATWLAFALNPFDCREPGRSPG